jgi:hypothetical protein
VALGGFWNRVAAVIAIVSALCGDGLRLGATLAFGGSSFAAAARLAAGAGCRGAAAGPTAITALAAATGAVAAAIARAAAFYHLFFRSAACQCR